MNEHLKDTKKVLDGILDSCKTVEEYTAAFDKYLRQLSQLVSCDDAGNVIVTEQLDRAIMIYNTILCHLDVLDNDTVTIKGCHRQALNDFCRSLRTIQTEKVPLVDLTKSIIVPGKKTSNRIQIGGIRKITPYSTRVGIINPYFFDSETVRCAVVGACANCAPASQIAIDAGTLVNLGRRFAGFKFRQMEPGLEEVDFIEMVDTLIDTCFRVYGTTTTQTLMTNIAKNLLLAKPNSKVEIFEHLNKHGIDTDADELIDCLDIFANTTNCDGMKYGLSLFYPWAVGLSVAWVHEINELADTKNFRIGFVDMGALTSDSYEVGKHVLVPSGTCSFLVAENYNEAARIQESGGTFAVSYVWQGAHIDGQGQRSAATFTLDEVIDGKYFDEGGYYTMKAVIKTLNITPKIAEYYNVSSSAKILDASLVNDDSVFVVNIRKEQAKNQLSVWGETLSQQEAEEILPYLDFLPGQEQDDTQDTILCKMSSDPISSVASAVASTNKPCVIVKLKEKWTGY